MIHVTPEIHLVSERINLTGGIYDDQNNDRSKECNDQWKAFLYEVFSLI